MYKLYWSKNTGAFAPQAVLEELGADYQRVIINTQKGEHLQPEFLTLNPRAQVPALQLPDGSIMTESAAMVLYLADQDPNQQLAPAISDPARAKLYQWLFFFTCNLYEAELRYYYPARYANSSDARVSEAIREQAIVDLDRWWQIIEQALPDKSFGFLMGYQYSVVDIYLTMLATWHPNTTEFYQHCPKVHSVVRQVKARPAIQRIWDQHYDD